MHAKFLLGYNNNAANENIDKNGILSIVRSYYCCVENQDRGSIHIHLLIWLLGGCSPDEYKDKIKIQEFKEKL